MTDAVAEQVIQELQREPRLSANKIIALKKKISKKFSLPGVISNSKIITAARERGIDLEEQLKVRKVRSLSGVSVIAIMTKPAGCPGKCTYCPGGVTSPKSYTGHEPASLRAAQNGFDPYRQVQRRLFQLQSNGHDPEKCEVIVMGATFNAFPTDYQREFVKGMFDGANNSTSQTLEEAQKINETTKHRIIGLTFETRPDWTDKVDIEKFLNLGATRIELGVQSLDDSVLAKVQRGHGVKESAEATQRCKDSFLKVCHHFMPGLFSTPDKDVDMLRELFVSPDFRPDMLKIYPCLVMPQTPLYEQWKRGEFIPYTTEQAAEVIARAKQFVPEYCRIMRVDRDIPTTLVAAGVKQSNLREFVKEKCGELGIVCRCIRCREAGLKARFEEVPNVSEAKLHRIDYRASEGEEIFLSFEKDGALFGFCRLRNPGKPFMKEISSNTCGIRELHVYGDAAPIGGKGEVQHRGLGHALLAEAEKIAREEFDAKKVLVISGVGAREYYRKLGYERDGPYMGKILLE